MGRTVYTKERNQKVSDKLSGIKRSDETRKKMSISKTGTKLSAETKHKISLANKGRKKSDEAKEKIRQSVLEFYRNKRNESKGQN